MWWEIVVGGMVGFATYFYLHYLSRQRRQEQLEERVSEHASQNASETGTDNESVNWMNFFIKHWYLNVDEQLQEQIRSRVQPILDNLDLPAPITGVELESVSFGQSPPFIQYCRASKEKWGGETHKPALELVLGPRIVADEFQVKLNVGGLGNIEMNGLTFIGELQVTVLLDSTESFPCIKYVYFTFNERPDIKFDVSYGLIGLDVIPAIKNWVFDTIEQIISDTLVNPGRFLIDMSDGNMKTELIMGVRKLKRTVLHLQVELHKNKVVHTGRDEDRTISVNLNWGGQDKKTQVAFKRLKKTVHIWFPLAVLQEELHLSITNVKHFMTDDTLVELKLDTSDLVDSRTRELNRTPNTDLNLLTIVKATAYDLPFIPIRQNQLEVKDYTKYFEIPILSREDVDHCPSGLVYIHIHRLSGLPATDRNNLSDPYCKLKINGEKIFKTGVKNASLNPIFNFFEDVFVENVLTTEFLIEVNDFDALSSNDYIGCVTIPLADHLPKTVNKSFSLVNSKGASVGEIYLSLIFRPIVLPHAHENTVVNLINNLGTITILE